MEASKEQAKKTVEKLVEQFKEQYASYHKSSYDEATLRIDFINKFFKALGWDVDNEDGLAEHYREVIYEDRLKIGKGMKAPDYGFRISGSDKRLFFVEAKKPAVNIKTERQAAYQLRRYGRSAQTPVSILTNFEDFIVYDCSRTPSENDSPSVNRIKSIHYENYIVEFDFIYGTFSREAVVKGFFEKYVKSDANKRGSVPLDTEFVEVLNGWRKELAVTIARNNRELNEDQINFAVQQTIDRLIFLRFCEERAVEHYGNLKSTTTKGDTYKNLLHVFHEADMKYNSGLFDFEKDKITKNLKVDNKIVKNIVLDLYPPKSDYEFAVMPVEILGNAYEQFLGKVIRITKSHSAVIDDKPEVRKAGGVFYTPQYIVDYIVEHTVGELVRGKGPKEIEKIKIVDPACGSGSFLLGVFKYLIKHYTDWYLANGYGDKKNGGGKLTPDGSLTTAEKRKILLTHVYGVDLDANAVEVSKLSLLLKCMEGETQASINQQLSLHHERILPDLDRNILCGNSLIGHDFFDTELGFDSAEMQELQHKIKPFDWQHAFPQVFKQGGFDAVVGNPPYGAEFSEVVSSYLTQKFPNQNYQLDSYLLFLEQTLKILLGKDGLFGMIIPNPWLTNLFQKKLRQFVLDNSMVNQIVHFRTSVFPKVTVDTEIVLLKMAKLTRNSIAKAIIVKENIQLLTGEHYSIDHNQRKWIELDGEPINIFLTKEDEALIKKMSQDVLPLETYFKINVGIKPYQVGKGKPKQTRQDVEERVFDSNIKLNSKYRRILRGRDINKYIIAPVEDKFIKYGDWLAEPRPDANFEAPFKIFVRQTGDSLIAALDSGQNLCMNNMHVVVPLKDVAVSFYLGIINSKLLNWYYQTINPEKGEALAEVKKTHLANLPMKIISKSRKQDKSLQDKIVQQVDSMLELKVQAMDGMTPTARQQHESRIAYTDRKIDELVYQLYGLTPEEVAIVEGA